MSMYLHENHIARRKTYNERHADPPVSDFVTPSTGPDQWFVATLVLLFALYFAREMYYWTRARSRNEET